MSTVAGNEPTEILLKGSVSPCAETVRMSLGLRGILSTL